MAANPYVRRYHETQATTLQPDDLLLMLVDCALLRAEQARDAPDLAGRRAALDKLRRIVSELIESLNVDQGGEVAVSLMRAYVALLRQVLIARGSGDDRALADVHHRVGALHEMWHATVRAARDQRAAEAA